MNQRTAQVVDLNAFRKRREEERSHRDSAPPMVVLVPLWMWVPVWTPNL
jgi:hypothetical protein